MIPYWYFVITKYVSILHSLTAFILHKLYSPSQIIFTDDVHVLIHTLCLNLFVHSSINMKSWLWVMSIRILITNLNVLCFDIYAIPTLINIENNLCLYSIYIQRRLNHVSEMCLVNILTFWTWCVTVILLGINYFESLTISMHTM